MKFSDLYINSMYKNAKFINNSCCVCALCSSPVQLVGLFRDSEVNINHIYSLGQLYRCSCGKSQIWTNSLRNPKNFVELHKNGQVDKYYNGFCNDRFCPFCGSDFDILKNGINFNGVFYDVIGCYKGYKTDKHNTNILIDFDKEDAENSIEALKLFYQSKINDIISKEGLE